MFHFHNIFNGSEFRCRELAEIKTVTRKTRVKPLHFQNHINHQTSGGPSLVILKITLTSLRRLMNFAQRFATNENQPRWQKRGIRRMELVFFFVEYIMWAIIDGQNVI